MANVVSLHSRQVFLSAGEPAPYAKAYFYLSGTQTQVNVFADVGLVTQRSQPVVCDAHGVLPPCYVSETVPLRVLITDEVDVELPGYPMDNIVPELAEAQDASGVAYNPSEGLPFTNVQAAIEGAAALFVGQSDLLSRYFALQTTGGTGDAYTITPTPAVPVYLNGLSYMVMPDRFNTGAATLNVNGVGAVPLMKMGGSGTPVQLAAGEIKAWREFRVVYDGTRFLVSLGRDFPLRGWNSNGTWSRLPNGQQVCLKSPLTVPYAAAESVAVNWTFPIAFDSITDMVVMASICPPNPASVTSAAFSGTAATGPSEISSMVIAGYTTTTAGIRITRAAGQDNFQASDNLYVAIRAEGRWF